MYKLLLYMIASATLLATGVVPLVDNCAHVFVVKSNFHVSLYAEPGIIPPKTYKLSPVILTLCIYLAGGAVPVPSCNCVHASVVKFNFQTSFKAFDSYPPNIIKLPLYISLFVYLLPTGAVPVVDN